MLCIISCHFHLLIGFSSSTTVTLYRRSADSILIQSAQQLVLQQSARCNVKPISQSTVSIMKKRLFRHVELKAPNNNFSKCSECDFFQDFISRYPRGCDEWATLANDRTKHINYQKLVVVFTMDGAPTPLIVLRSSSALFTTKWITLSPPSHECSGPRRPHVGLGRSPYLLAGCLCMGTATERTLTTPQHSGLGTQTLLSPPFVGFLEHWNDLP